MAFSCRAHVVRLMRQNGLATPYIRARRRVPAEGRILQTVWLSVALMAMLAATFGLSCLAYYRLAADSQRATEGPLGELWNGVLP